MQCSAGFVAFTSHIQPLVASLAQMDCHAFNYADDTQILLRLDRSPLSQTNTRSILRFIVSCIAQNSLKLNPDKTEIVLINGQANKWSDLYWPPEMGSPLYPPLRV